MSLAHRRTIFLSMKPPPPRSTLFPYTTLFRSRESVTADRRASKAGPRTGLLVPLRSSHAQDRKSTRLNSSHVEISYAVFCLIKKSSIVMYRSQVVSSCSTEHVLEDPRVLYTLL